MKSLVILAAGQGSRTGLNYNKMLYKINNKTILQITLEKFKSLDFFGETIIVVSQEEQEIVKQIANMINYKVKVVVGDEQRYLSVYKGVEKCNYNYIYVHDGARANIKQTTIKNMEQIITNNENISCFVLATKVKDTISVVEDGYIKQNLKRENLMNIQTPQVIKKDQYLKIFNKNEMFTDESSLFYNYGYDVKIIENDDSNFKVTTKEDLKRLEEEYE